MVVIFYFMVIYSVYGVTSGCETGYYGSYCNQTCHCQNITDCNPVNGSCSNGCAIWWIGRRCHKHIELLNVSTETGTVLDTTNSSISVIWQPISNISEDMWQYYGYAIKYKVAYWGSGYVTATNITYHGGHRYRIDHLRHSTVYQIRIEPFRTHRGYLEAGHPYPIITGKTDCIAPSKPMILNASLLPGDLGLDRIAVAFESLYRITPHCDYIKSYRLVYNVDNFTDSIYINTTERVFAFQPKYKGEYDLRLVVTNNEGYSSTSNTTRVALTDCAPHYYGSRCEHKCGRCENGTVCDGTNGTCASGCRMWWYGPKCDRNLNISKLSNETLEVESNAPTAITVRWQHIPGVPAELAKSFGYSVQYRRHGSGDAYAEAFNRSYGDSPSGTITGLAEVTRYDVVLVPFTRHGNYTEYGTPYPAVVASTMCQKPEPLNITELAFTHTGITHLNLTVHFEGQNITLLDPHCEEITSVSVLYKLQTDDHFKSISVPRSATSQVISLGHVGVYDVKLVVRNNEGLQSASEVVSINVTDCPHMHYGDRCQYLCGRCQKHGHCDPVTGVCSEGCKEWWVGDRCKHYVSTPVAPDENLTVISRSHNGLTISWPNLLNVSDADKPYLGYKIKIRADGKSEFRHVTSQAYLQSNNTYRLDKLMINGVYDIVVVPFRRVRDQVQEGNPYPMLRTKTRCLAPGQHEFVDAKLITGKFSIPTIAVAFLNMTHIDSKCDYIKSVIFMYKLKQDTNFTKIVMPITLHHATVIPWQKGEYDLLLEIQNNDGHTSQSELVTITVGMCNPGYYGPYCKHKCGMCIRPHLCMDTNGTCRGGCKPWWTASRCDQEVKLLNRTNETISLQSKANDSLTLVWEDIRGVESNLERFYGYSIQYKEHGAGGNYTEVATVAYGRQPSLVIGNLPPNTAYDVRVVPYRTNHTERDYGAAFPVLEAKTNCVAPEKPVIGNATMSRNSDGVDLAVSFQGVARLKPGCDRVANVTLFYRRVGEEQFRTVDIRPGATSLHVALRRYAKYELKLRVRNNEGHESTSDVFEVGIELCDTGYYGADCKPCGHCEGDPCDVVTGYCPGGCLKWAAGDRCQFLIVPPELPNNTVEAVAVGTRNITIGWQQIPGVTPEVYKYYGLNVIVNSLHGLKDNRVVPYTGNSTVIGNLNYDTLYNIQIDIFRKNKDALETGRISNIVRARTKCKEPPPMKITDIKQLDSGTGMPKMEIWTDNTAALYTDCGRIARARVLYKRRGEAEFREEHLAGDLTKWSFLPKTPGDYVVQFITENKQGVETTGPVQTVPVACYPGYYGAVCQNKCGHCRKPEECDQVNGTCMNGCQTWWTGAMCDGYIELPKVSNETARVRGRTNTSISFSWEPIHSIKPELEQYYGYAVQYKRLGRDSNFSRIPGVAYSSNLSDAIRNLTPYTDYAIQIVPFRRHRSSVEYGAPYRTVTTRTYCGVPVKPAKPKVKQISGEYGLPNVTLLVERMPSEDVRCDNVTSLVLRYKMANEDNYKVVSLDPDRDNNVQIRPREEGQLEWQLIVQNNADFETSSDIWRVPVIMKCKIGFYGHQCKEKCAKCKGSPACEKDTGACPNGCQVWWAGIKCDKYIDMPNNTTTVDSATPSDGNTIVVKWKHISNISNEIGHHYGYSLQYKIHDSDDNYTEAAALKVALNYTAAIRHLRYNTMYDIKIAFFKSHGNLRHYETDFKTVTVKTGCGEPEKPKFLNTTLISSASRLPNISVTIENITNQMANCDNITSIMLLYKLKEAANFTVIRLRPGQRTCIIVPEEAGDYLLKLVIRNNKGLTSTSDVQVVRVEKPILLSMMSMILPGAILTALAAVLITVTAAVLCKGSSSKYRN